MSDIRGKFPKTQILTLLTLSLLTPVPCKDSEKTNEQSLRYLKTDRVSDWRIEKGFNMDLPG